MFLSYFSKNSGGNFVLWCFLIMNFSLFFYFCSNVSNFQYSLLNLQVYHILPPANLFWITSLLVFFIPDFIIAFFRWGLILIYSSCLRVRSKKLMDGAYQLWGWWLQGDLAELFVGSPHVDIFVPLWLVRFSREDFSFLAWMVKAWVPPLSRLSRGKTLSIQKVYIDSITLVSE